MCFGFTTNFSMATGFGPNNLASQAVKPAGTGPRYQLLEPYVLADPPMEQSVFSEQATGISGSEVTMYESV